MSEVGFLVLRSADEALRIWAEYRHEGAEDPSRRVGPRLPGRRSPLKGLRVPHAVALFVESVPGFEGAEPALRAAYGLAARTRRVDPGDGHVCAWPPTVEAFRARIAQGLPREFRPPHAEPCERELEEMLQSQETRSQAEIDARFRALYPGMVRDGFRWERRG